MPADGSSTPTRVLRQKRLVLTKAALGGGLRNGQGTEGRDATAASATEARSRRRGNDHGGRESTGHPRRRGGPVLEPHQVILRPLITEKGTHQFTHRNAYPFEVNQWANKDQIKAAVQELFGVRVEKVRTQNRLGKLRRYRSKMGKLPNWKKAIVTLTRPDSPTPDRVLLRGDIRPALWHEKGSDPFALQCAAGTWRTQAVAKRRGVTPFRARFSAR